MIKKAIFIAMQYTFTQITVRGKIGVNKLALLLMILVLAGGSKIAFAGGKPVGKKRLFLIPAASYFFNSTYWDKDGNYRTYNDNLKFGSKILSLSSEYGFSRKVSFVGSVPFIINSITSNSSNASVAGLGDAELGVRYYVANINYNVYFSIQGNVVVPLYTNTATKNLGYDKLGGEIKGIGAGDFAIGAKKFYWEASVGGRQFAGSEGPFQFKGSLSLSYSINKKNQVSLAETSLYSYSATKTEVDPDNPLNVANSKQFNFNQLTGSYAYSIKRNKSLFVSFSKFITGTNTGAGTTISVGYVYKY
jgi:hypothetical protein